jgi:hypothetical protein
MASNAVSREVVEILNRAGSSRTSRIWSQANVA